MLVGIATVLVVVVGAVTWYAVASHDDTPAKDPRLGTVIAAGGPRVGDVAPDFAVRTLDGTKVELSDFRGTPVVLNFWASYCNPCRKEFPLFRRELLAHPGKFVVLGVDYRDIASDARDFAKTQRATWPIVADPDGAVGKVYGIRAVPQTFFIRRDGTISQRYYAQVPDAAFGAELAKIIGRTSATTTTSTAPAPA